MFEILEYLPFFIVSDSGSIVSDSGSIVSDSGSLVSGSGSIVSDSGSLVSGSGSLKNGKWYGCRFCGKIFDRPSRITVHERIHTGEKPFHCNICDRKFAMKGNMKSHQLTHQRKFYNAEDF